MLAPPPASRGRQHACSGCTQPFCACTWVLAHMPWVHVTCLCMCAHASTTIMHAPICTCAWGARARTFPCCSVLPGRQARKIGKLCYRVSLGLVWHAWTSNCSSEVPARVFLKTSEWILWLLSCSECVLILNLDLFAINSLYCLCCLAEARENEQLGSGGLYSRTIP